MSAETKRSIISAKYEVADYVPTMPVHPESKDVGMMAKSYAALGYLSSRAAWLNVSHADGFSSRRTVLIEAMRNAADVSARKDIDATEEQDAAELIMHTIDLIGTMRMQFIMRKLAPRIVQSAGSDAGPVWTEQTWTEVLSETIKTGLQLPPGIIGLIHLLYPIIYMAPEYPYRSSPPSFTTPWAAWMPSADYRTKLAVVSGKLNSAIRHFSKTGYVLKRLASGDILTTRFLTTSLPTDEVLYWRYQTRWHGNWYDTGADHLYQLCPPGDFSNSTIGYTYRRYYWVTRPWWLQSLQQWLEPYTATHNPCGCLKQATLTGLTSTVFGGYVVKFDTDTIQLMAFDLAGGTISSTAVSSAHMLAYYVGAAAYTSGPYICELSRGLGVGAPEPVIHPYMMGGAETPGVSSTTATKDAYDNAAMNIFKYYLFHGGGLPTRGGIRKGAKARSMDMDVASPVSAEYEHEIGTEGAALSDMAKTSYAKSTGKAKKPFKKSMGGKQRGKATKQSRKKRNGDNKGEAETV